MDGGKWTTYQNFGYNGESNMDLQLTSGSHTIPGWRYGGSSDNMVQLVVVAIVQISVIPLLLLLLFIH